MSQSDYVLGLIAGEGCFSVGIEYKSSYKYGVCTRWLFHLSMTDQFAVECVADEIGLDINIKTRSRGGNRSKIYEILVRNREQIERIVKWVNHNRTVPFDKSDKASVFDSWARLWNDRDDLMSTKEGTKELVRRAFTLNNRDDIGKSVSEVVSQIETSE